jgi:methionine aminopeptidase
METLETEVFINEGESASEAVKFARDFSIEQAKQLMQLPDHQHIEEKYIPESQLPVIEYYDPRPREQTLEEQIASCTDIKVLESYKFIAKKDPSLQLEYEKRMYILKELSPKQ